MGWIRTVLMNWIAWNINIFLLLNCVLMLNWIVWNRTVYLYKMVGWVLCHINLCWLFNAKFCVCIYVQPKIFKYIVGKIFDKRDFICLHTINRFNSSYFWYNPVSCKKDRTSSILKFSNRSIKLFILKNRFLMRAKALYSMRMCSMVQGVWQVKHCGYGSCFSMKEWVSLVWPMRNRHIMTFSLFYFLKAGLHSPKEGWIWKSLLWILLFHSCCNFVWRNLLIRVSGQCMESWICRGSDLRPIWLPSLYFYFYSLQCGLWSSI